MANMTKRWMWLLPASVVLLAACGPAQSPGPGLSLVADPPPTEDGQQPGLGTSDLDRGIAYVEKEAWEQAATHLDRAVTAQPKNAEAHYYRALVYRRAGADGEAEAGFVKAIELNPKLFLAHAHLGEMLLTAHEPMRAREAIEPLTVAAKGMPEDADIQQLLGFAHRVERQYDKSKKHYLKALAIEGDDKVRFDYADMLFEAREMDLAVEQMRKLVPVHAKDKRVMAQLAHRFAKAKAYADCVDAFDRALLIDSKEPGFYLHRGLCKHSLKRSEEQVRADLDKALEVNPKFQPAYYYMGMSWLHSRKRHRAIKAFKQAVKLGENTPVGKKARAKIDDMKKKR